MKKLLALLLALIMVLSLVACGEKDEPADKGNEGEKTGETTEATEPAPEYPPVTIGDLTIEYESAIKYTPFGDDQWYMLIYFNITNNSNEPIKPSKVVFAQAKANEKNLNVGVQFQEDNQPELHNSFYNEIAPGETVRVMEALCPLFDNGERVETVYEITIMDMYHQIEEKLTVTIDTTTLEVVSEA